MWEEGNKVMEREDTVTGVKLNRNEIKCIFMYTI
jgi:hypothetical protein